jgi:hypothetical protein
MAESIVQVTEGSGKKLHTFQKTIGANNVEDEIVTLSDQYLASSHLMQLMAGASLNVYVRRIRLYQLAAATTVTVGQVNINRLTTAGTGGTAVTPAPLDTTDAASGATAMVLPTVLGTVGTVIERVSAYFVQTINASTPAGGLILDVDFDRLHMKPLRIPAGITQGISVTLVTAIAGGTVLPVIEFTEASF